MQISLCFKQNALMQRLLNCLILPEVGFGLEVSARRICTFCGKIEREQSPDSGIYRVLSHNPTHLVEREGFYLLLNATIPPVSKNSKK